MITTEEKTRPTDKIEIREAFERWQRWRAGAKYYGDGRPRAPGAGLLGRLRESKGRSTCPVCRGAKRIERQPCHECGGVGLVDGDLSTARRVRQEDCTFCRVKNPDGSFTSRGEINGRTCPKCRGGRRTWVELKVHPATIKGTRYLGPDPDADPVALLIDRLVKDWRSRDLTYWLARVVEMEYGTNGTQEMKAMRLRVSRAWYVKNLSQAHQLAGEALNKNK